MQFPPPRLSVSFLFIPLLSVSAFMACAPYLSRGQRTDEGIKYTVEKKLMFAGVDVSHIDIEVDNGVVTVAGLAADSTQRAAIFKTLEHVPGASRVYIHVDVDQ